MRRPAHRRLADRRLADRGSVTVEFALGLPSVVLVLALALSAIAWMLDVQAAQRGASEAARAAIVAPDGTAISVGRRVSGESRVTIARAGDYVTACVAGERAPWPPYERCATARALP